MTLSPLGDSAVVLSLGEDPGESAIERARVLASAIAGDPPRGTVEVVPAFATVTLFYDAAAIGGFAEFCAEIERRVARASGSGVFSREPRVVEIPVCYGGEFGPDLGEVAALHCMGTDDVIALHSGGSYIVQAIGFAPGFGYLGGLAGNLHTPRRGTPRTAVPAGSVGIGGALTAVYPFALPGGWNLIGRTPLAMFDAGRPVPSLIRAGDRVRFRAISGKEFAAWK